MASVPLSLGLFLGLLRRGAMGDLGSAMETTLKQVTSILGKVSQEAASRDLIARAPSILQILVTNLVGGDKWGTLRLLSNIAGAEAHRGAIASIPGCLRKLVAIVREGPRLDRKLAGQLLEQLTGGHGAAGAVSGGSVTTLWEFMRGDDPRLHVAAASALAFLAKDPEKRTAMMELVGVQQIGLLLQSGDSQVRGSLAALLSPLMADSGVRKILATSRECLLAVVGVLGTKDGDVQGQEAAATVLCALMRDPETRKGLVRTPELLQGLCGLLGRGMADSPQVKGAAAALSWVATDRRVFEVAVRTPGILRLMELLDGGAWAVGTVLVCLSRQPQFAEAVANTPGVVSIVVRLLRDERGEARKYAAHVVRGLALDKRTRKTVLEEPGVLQGLVGVLKERDDPTVEAAAGVLWALAKFGGAQTRKAIAEVPECLGRLVGLLTANVVVQESAVGALMELVQESEVNHSLRERVPGSLVALVELLKVGAGANSVVTQIAVVRALYYLASVAGNREIFARLPECVPRLADLLRHPTEVLRKWAVRALSNLSPDAKVCAALLDSPRALEDLVQLLDSKTPKLPGAVLQILFDLTKKSGHVKAVGKFPGCLSRLAALLVIGTRELVVGTLRVLANLAADKEVSGAIVSLPDLVPRIVSLLNERSLCGEPAEWAPAAASLLHNLARNPEHMSALAREPGSMAGLFNLLEKSPSEGVRVSAADTLVDLLRDGEAWKTVAVERGIATLLVGLLDEGEELRTKAATIIAVLARDPANRTLLAREPSCVAKLARAVEMGEGSPMTQFWVACAICTLLPGADCGELEREILSNPRVLLNLASLANGKIGQQRGRSVLNRMGRWALRELARYSRQLAKYGLVSPELREDRQEMFYPPGQHEPPQAREAPPEVAAMEGCASS